MALYRSLLRVLPAPLRERHGEEMVELFRDLARDVRTERGRLAAARFGAGAFARLLLAGLAARFRSTADDPPSPAPTDPRFREPLMPALVRDARYGLRALRHSPGYALVVVVTLALAIGVNTTIYSMVRMTLDPPFPYVDQNELVVPYGRNPEIGRVRSGVSLPDLLDVAARSRTLRAVAGRRSETVALTGADQPVRVPAVRITTNTFPMLGVVPILGRTFSAEESTPGSDRVLLLGHGGWERRFGSDPEVVGRAVSIDGVEHTVIGVLPEALDFGSSGSVEVYRPIVESAAAERDRRDLYAIARLAPGATLEQARAELADLAGGLRERHPDTNAGWELYALGFREAVVGPNALVVFTLMSVAVAFVLLIACVNVANLTLARAYRRARELSLRSALGAGRASLVRTLLTESVLLALAAGALGLVVARTIFAALVAAGNGRIGLFDELQIDAGVFGFTLGLALATPLIFGLWPALRACRGDLATALREGAAAGMGRREQRARRLMVSAQVAMAVALLIVAGLATRSTAALLALDLGFDPGRILTFRITLSEANPEPTHERFETLREAIEALPGVRDAGLTRHLPIAGGDPSLALRIEGRDAGLDQGAEAVAVAVATPRYFDALGLPTLRGRPIETGDTHEAAPIAVVNRAAAERFWPGADPVGSRIRTGDSETAWREVVGVVADTRNPDADLPPAPQVYLPLAQAPQTSMAFVLRTSGDPAALVPAVRNAVWRVDPAQPIEDVRTMEQVRYDDLAGDITVIGLLAFFSLVALALSVAGVYGVMAYSVSQRTREIGIRLAVGARAGDVQRQIAGQGLRMVAAGGLVGLTGGFLLSRLITGMLFGISSTDPVTFLGVPALLALVGLLAAVLPARRAARLDPVWTLRAD